MPRDMYEAGNGMIFCRYAPDGDALIPGRMDNDNGCVITFGGSVQSNAKQFEVLTGRSGYPWKMPNKNQGIGNDAYEAGQDGGPLYLGRCPVRGQPFIGKVDSNVKMYFTMDGQKEETKCDNPPEIMVCQKQNQG